MKLINHSKLRVYLLHPTIGRHIEERMFFGRKGTRLQMDTGFTYLKANEDSGSWIEFRLLGFGLGFYWNFTGDSW